MGMTPELFVQIVQLGAVGLLALVLWFGLQHNGRMLEILATSLKQCQDDNRSLLLKILELLGGDSEEVLGQKEID